MVVVFVTKHGTKIGKHQERITLYIPDPETPDQEISVKSLEEIIIEANASISTQAIKLAAQQGIPILFMAGNIPLAILHPEVAHGSVEVRRQQMMAYYDERGVQFANQVVKAGMLNKQQLLQTLCNRRNLDPKTYGEIQDAIEHIETQIHQLPVKGTKLPMVREKLFGLEGEAAKHYFRGLRAVIGEKWGFEKRNRRPPQDPINSMLSYGYAILYSKLFSAVVIAGLECFAGFLHTDRSGKPSLVLDLIEEFRQPVVDKTILRITGRNMVSPEDFETTQKGCMIMEKAKKILVEELYDELDRKIPTPHGKLSMADILIYQARNAGKFFRRITPKYKPFIMSG